MFMTILSEGTYTLPKLIAPRKHHLLPNEKKGNGKLFRFGQGAKPLVDIYNIRGHGNFVGNLVATLVLIY